MIVIYGCARLYAHGTLLPINYISAEPGNLSRLRIFLSGGCIFDADIYMQGLSIKTSARTIGPRLKFTRRSAILSPLNTNFPPNNKHIAQINTFKDELLLRFKCLEGGYWPSWAVLADAMQCRRAVLGKTK